MPTKLSVDTVIITIKKVSNLPKDITIVQFSSVAQSCLTLYDPMNCSMLELPVHHQIPEFTETHGHWVGDAIHQSHPLLSPFPPAFNLFQHQGLFQSVSSLHQVANILEFQHQYQSFQRISKYSWLISFRMDWFDLLAVQVTCKSLLQHHSSKALILWRSVFFIVQHLYAYMTTGKTTSLTKWTSVGKVMSLLFNMLSRLVILFFQGASVFKFHGCSHHLELFWSPKNKVGNCFHCFPIYLPSSDGTRCQDHSFLNVEF